MGVELSPRQAAAQYLGNAKMDIEGGGGKQSNAELNLRAEMIPEDPIVVGIWVASQLASHDSTDVRLESSLTSAMSRFASDPVLKYSVELLSAGHRNQLVESVFRDSLGRIRKATPEAADYLTKSLASGNISNTGLARETAAMFQDTLFEALNNDPGRYGALRLYGLYHSCPNVEKLG